MRERGLKSLRQLLTMVLVLGRSREGAWIEIELGDYMENFQRVAPVRERGLKLVMYILMIELS